MAGYRWLQRSSLTAHRTRKLAQVYARCLALQRCALHNVCPRERAECSTSAWRFVFSPRCIATHVSPVPLTRTPRIPHLPLQLHIREHVLQCSVQRLHGRGGKTAHHICVDNVLHVRAEPLRLYSTPTYTLSVAHCLVFL